MTSFPQTWDFIKGRSYALLREIWMYIQLVLLGQKGY